MKPKSTPHQSDTEFVDVHSLILPVITVLVHRLSKTKFTKCVANKRHKHVLFDVFHSCLGDRVVYSCFMFFPSLSFSSACPQGTFKSVQGTGLCQQCPLNSRSTIEAATLCGCRNGYYRGDMDKPEDVCTSESSLCQTNTYAKKQNYILNKPFSSAAECDYASGRSREVCEGRFLD